MNLTRLARLIAPLALLLLAGCGKKEAAADSGAAPALKKVRFQTDWYPQAEHGGFYQALAKGYYRDAGLDVEILQGGPGPTAAQKVMGGSAEIAMGSSDAIMVNVANGLPFIMIGATMQHDPQAILVHDESPVKTFSDLNGKSIMALPGSNWIDYLKARYTMDFKLIPLNFSLAQFMADKNFIQQCFITNEPFYAGKNGAKARALLIADSGYDPYRVFFTTQRYAKENPETVRAFVAASIRGWDDFITGDPSPAKALIAKRNEQMSEEFMNYSLGAMKEHELVAGHPAAGERTGLLTHARMQAQMDLLVKLKIIPTALPLEKVVSFDFLPASLAALSK
jgi:NitT/TauT family transport system substrate-binding protein